MLGGHYGEIYRLCKNFSPEEKKLVAMTIPTKMLEDELERRSKVYNGVLEKLCDALDNANVETLDSAEETIKLLRTILHAK